MQTFVCALGIVLAFIGLYISVYFTLVYYGVVKPNARLIPRFCQLEGRSCETVLGSKYARVFGVPNSLLGSLFYVGVVAILANGSMPPAVGIAAVITAWFTVALGVFLAYALFFLLRIPCPLCLTAHLINLLVALILTFQLI